VLAVRHGCKTLNSSPNFLKGGKNLVSGAYVRPPNLLLYHHGVHGFDHSSRHQRDEESGIMSVRFLTGNDHFIYCDYLSRKMHWLIGLFFF
jgi:hypothetical protein